MGLVAAALVGCGRASREPLLTYFNGDLGFSIRYPASWKTEQAEQDGVWYRYFLAPPTGPKNQSAVSVTLLVSSKSGSVDDYAQSYLGDHDLAATRAVERGPAVGKAYSFQSKDKTRRYSLLLLKLESRVLGVYAQGETPLFERYQKMLEEIAASLTLERPADYPELRNDKFGFSLRLPASWKETRNFSGGSNLLVQYLSPPLAADKGREPVHAALTMTVEPATEGIDEYYAAARAKLGDAFPLLAHAKWGAGYADMMRTETSVAVSRVKRFYRVGGGRGYTLAFEAREDVFPRVSKWCDMIAGTLRTGEETKSR